MEPAADRPATRKSGLKTVIASFAALYLVVCLCLAIYVFLFRQQIPGLQGYFPTETSQPSPTPFGRTPGPGNKVFEEDFSDNQNLWFGAANPATRTRVTDGKLRLTALDDGYSGEAYCRSCPSLASPFYIQADFSTDHSVDESYGLAFSGTAAHQDFYLFEINAQQGRYDFYRYKLNHWLRRVSNSSDVIERYPGINTLGVGLEGEVITLYINGQVVDTYRDTGSAVTAGFFWPTSDNSGFTLNVDNIFAYGR